MSNTAPSIVEVILNKVVEGFENSMLMTEIIDTDMTFVSNLANEKRSNEEAWFPQKIIQFARDGSDATNTMADTVQLSVPGRVNQRFHVPFLYDERDLKDPQFIKNCSDAAITALAERVNETITRFLANTGTHCIRRTTSPTGIDDILAIDNEISQIGLQYADRILALTTPSYNGMASNLAARQTMNEKPTKAFEKAYIGNVVGDFEIFKQNYSTLLLATTATSITVNGGGQNYIPTTNTTSLDGSTGNKDNRFQQINLTVGAGNLRVGTFITFAGVTAVNFSNKTPTEYLKKFKIVDGPVGGGSGIYTISPPIISNPNGNAGNPSERQYQNVTATPANGAVAIVLNNVTTGVNPWWLKSSIKFLPSQVSLPEDCKEMLGMTTLKNGLSISMSRGVDAVKFKSFYRFDIFFGLVNLNPEMNGVLLFNQI